MTIEAIDHHTQSVKLFQDHFQGREITGIEIGTGCAVWSTFLLQELPNLKKLFTIDPWRADLTTEYGKFYPQWVLDGNKITAYARLADHHGRVEIIELPSSLAVARFKEPVDFVWIDGDHSPQEAEKDIRNYMPLVKDGGILGGHDYNILDFVIKPILGDVQTGADLTWWMVKNG